MPGVPKSPGASPKRVNFPSASSSSSTEDITSKIIHYNSDSDSEKAYSGKITKDAPAQIVLMGVTLLLLSVSYQVSTTIRYSFLADAFSKRNISGNIYGLMEGSIFFGYLAAFLSRSIELAMKHFKSKYLMMFVLIGLFVTTVGSGLAYLIEDNYVLVIVSFVFRIAQGFFTYYSGLIVIDFVAVAFPKYFDILVGVTSSACYFGHVLAEGVGSVLYDNFGYIPPFFFAGSICMVTFFMVTIIIPPYRCHLATQDSPAVETNTTKRSRGVTPYIVPALVACMFVNISYGFLQVTTTPYLYNVHSKSISYGGLVLSVSSIGMVLGALVAGFIMQREYVLPATQMGLGSLMVGIGIFATFPNPSMKLLFDNAPIVSFPAAFIVGFGDPFITVGSLRCMYQLQLQQRRQLTPKQSTLITGLWLVGYNAFWYAGTIVSGVFCDIMSYSDSADILAAMSIVSMLICEVLRHISKTNKISDETVPLLTGH